MQWDDGQVVDLDDWLQLLATVMGAILASCILLAGSAQTGRHMGLGRDSGGGTSCLFVCPTGEHWGWTS